MPLSFTVSVHMRTGPGPQPSEAMSSHVSSDKISLGILSHLQPTNKSSVLYSFVSLTYSWSIFRYIHTLRDCKKTLHVFLNKNVMSVNLITAAMLELTKRFSPLDSYPYLASPQTSLGVRSSFLPHRRRPWGSNECVTNEPQRTSAGKLTPIQPHANSENSGCLDT